MNDNDEMTEYAGWITLIGITVGLLIIGLAVVKVRNELKMTQAYERQAVALERAADALERAHPMPETISQVMARVEFENWMTGVLRKNKVIAQLPPCKDGLSPIGAINATDEQLGCRNAR